jgi:hypothetical protein
MPDQNNLPTDPTQTITVNTTNEPVITPTVQPIEPAVPETPIEQPVEPIIPPAPVEPTQPAQSEPFPEVTDAPFPLIDEGSAPTLDIPPIISEPEPKKKFLGGKIIPTILGLLLLIGGVSAGVFLVKQQQDLRSQAGFGECGKGDTKSGYRCAGNALWVKDTTTTITPKTSTTTTTGGTTINLQTDSNNCGSVGKKCATGATCSQGSCSVITTGGGGKSGEVCYSNSDCGSGQVCQSGTCVYSSGTTGGTTGSTPGITTSTTLACYVCRLGTCASTRYDNCNPKLNTCKLDTDCGATTNSNTYSATLACYVCRLGTCASTRYDNCNPALNTCNPNTTNSCTTTGGTGGGCGAEGDICDEAWCCVGLKCDIKTGQINGVCVKGTGGSSSGDGGTTVVTPTTTPTTPPVIAQCLNIKIFDTSWNEISTSSLSTLAAGKVVRFTVAGSPAASFDKAKFVINGTEKEEVTSKRPSTNEYYYEYTLPSGIINFTINAKLHLSVTNQWI